MDKKVTDERLKKDSETLVYLLDEACDVEKDWHWVDSRAKVIQQTVEDLKNAGDLEVKFKECEIEDRKLKLDEKYRPLELEEEKNKNKNEKAFKERESYLEERKIALDETYRPLELEEERKKNEKEAELRMRQTKLEEARLEFEEKLEPLRIDIEKQKLELEKIRLSQELKIAEAQEKGSRWKLWAMVGLGVMDLGSRAFFTYRISRKEQSEPLLTQTESTVARMAIKDTPLFSKFFK